MIAVLVANVLGWPLIHFLVSKWAFQKKLSDFEKDRWYYKPFFWERDGRFYERVLKIKRWKRLLPDGARMLGHGFSKNSIKSRDPIYLKNFILETRRGEWAHGVTLCFAPVFFIWNPLWADLVMLGYALIANLPCIAAQRYNRIVIQRLLGKTRRQPSN